ncbi:MAG: DUF4037 domain-containing protein [Oscillospiraceae bacterium]|jgi:hypothetical protein|nr:DUF4037 domain-containing protein [Oscillospiraceae bacterium]
MLKELIEYCLPMIRDFADGKYAITIGGSIGKGLNHINSDVDFRLYADDFVKGGRWDKNYAVYTQHMEYWEKRGLRIDSVWMRGISEIDEKLNKWLSGNLEPEMVEWTVWGYYLPTDIYNQQIIEDPYNIAADWKKRMEPYPQEMKTAVINKHMGRLKYWKNDYHYRNKTDRKDVVFLASLSANIVHDIMQALCAANDIYFPGDGHNLSVAGHFALKPDNFEKRIGLILYPEDTGESDKFEIQYSSAIAMINDVENIMDNLF